MTDELVQFLHDRLDEDEAFMQAAVRLRESGAITASPEATAGAFALMDVIADDAEALEALALFTRTGTRAPGEAERVLREVEAKRRIVDHVASELDATDTPWWYDDKLTPILEALALPYADHPGYKDTWRP